MLTGQCFFRDDNGVLCLCESFEEPSGYVYTVQTEVHEEP